MLRSSVPALVLYESIIGTKIHANGLSANRTARNELRRNSHIFLLFKPRPDCFSVVVGLLVARFTALPESIIPQRVKQVFVCAVVHVHVAVDVDIS